MKSWIFITPFYLGRYGERPDPEIVELPCLDTFLQTHVLQALCNRATRDLPRGTLPLMLGTVAALLRSVKYPLLSHQTIHKPVAHLISVAARYEALFVAAGSALPRNSSLTSERSSLDLATYKKRIG